MHDLSNETVQAYGNLKGGDREQNLGGRVFVRNVVPECPGGMQITMEKVSAGSERITGP